MNKFQNLSNLPKSSKILAILFIITFSNSTLKIENEIEKILTDSEQVIDCYSDSASDSFSYYSDSATIVFNENIILNEAGLTYEDEELISYLESINAMDTVDLTKDEEIIEFLLKLEKNEASYILNFD